MSSHAKSILGASFRRTCGTSSPRTTARQYPSWLSVSATVPLCANPQVTGALHRSLSQSPAFSIARRHIPFRKFIAGSPVQDVAVSTIRLRPRLPPLTLALFRSSPHKTRSRWISPPFRLYCTGGSPRPHQSQRQASIQRKHIRSASNEFLHQNPVKDDSVPRSESNPKASPSATKSQKIVSGPVAGKNLIDRLPNISHMQRPTKEELLAAATGFWSRLKVRFKWFSIRSGRPFNIDEISAFFSWILLGHVLWIILGTTTFFSLAIFAVNTVFAQGSWS